MLRNIVGSIKHHDIGSRRLKQAIDVLLDYLIQLDGHGEIVEPALEYQGEGGASLEGGFKRASKSDRRILLPPPDTSS